MGAVPEGAGGGVILSVKDLDSRIIRELLERGPLTHAELCRAIDVAVYSTEAARVRRRLHALHRREVLSRLSVGGSAAWWVRS